MENILMTGLLTIGGTILGAIIGGVYTERSAKIGFKQNQMKRDISKLGNQVKAYWYLEKEYLHQINSLNGISKETIKRNTRKIVKNNGYGYPKMTANNVDDILAKY